MSTFVPQSTPLFVGGNLRPPSNAVVLGSCTRVNAAHKRHLDRFSRSAGLTTVSRGRVQQTDKPRNIGNNRPHLIHAHAAIMAGLYIVMCRHGSVAEWLACWTQAQKGLGSNRAAATLSGNSLRQTVHTHRASVHQAAKLVAALLRVAG